MYDRGEMGGELGSVGFGVFLSLRYAFFLSLLRSMRGYYLMYLLSIPPIDWWPESRYRWIDR